MKLYPTLAVLSYSSLIPPPSSLKSNHRVGAAFDVDGVDEAYVPRLGGHYERVCTLARAEETDALEQRAIGHAGRGEDDLLAGREVVRLVNLVGVADAHLFEAREHFVARR